MKKFTKQLLFNAFDQVSLSTLTVPSFACWAPLTDCIAAEKCRHNPTFTYLGSTPPRGTTNLMTRKSQDRKVIGSTTKQDRRARVNREAMTERSEGQRQSKERKVRGLTAKKGEEGQRVNGKARRGGSEGQI